MSAVIGKRAIAMRTALDNLLKRYVSLANSGDCGFWEAEEEDQVKQARKAMAEFDEVMP